MSKSYELFLHWKQGDDFARALKSTKNNIPKALKLWADTFRANADVCDKLAESLADEKLSAEADTHHIAFIPLDRQAIVALETCVQAELLSGVNYDDEDEDDDEGLPLKAYTAKI